MPRMAGSSRAPRGSRIPNPVAHPDALPANSSSDPPGQVPYLGASQGAVGANGDD